MMPPLVLTGVFLGYFGPLRFAGNLVLAESFNFLSYYQKKPDFGNAWKGGVGTGDIYGYGTVLAKKKKKKNKVSMCVRVYDEL